MSDVESAAATVVVEAPSNAMTSLRVRARHAAFWALTGYTTCQVLRFASFMVFARLFADEKAVLGLMALATIFMQGLAMLTDMGLGHAVLQNPRGDEARFLNTVWTVQVLRGAILWLAALIGAYPFAAFYEQPQLASMIMVVGASALISGFNSTRLQAASRHLRLGRLNLIEIGCQLIALMTTLIWSYYERSIWALAAGWLISVTAKMLLSHCTLPGHPNRFCWDRAAARSLCRFGGWIFLSTTVTFWAGQLDRLLFAKLLPMDLFTDYHYAVLIIASVAMALGHVISSVVFPLYARVLDSGQQLGPVYYRVRGTVLTAGAWIFAGFMAGGSAAVDLILPPKYAAAGWMLEVLAGGAWFFLIEATNGYALLARGEPRWLCIAGAVKLVGMAICVPLGYVAFGLWGAILGYAASESLRYSITACAAHRRGLRGWPQDLGLSLLIATAAACGCATDLPTARWHDSAALRALMIFVVVTLIFVPAGLRVLSAHRALNRRAEQPAT
ncbi:MAG: oligosaccharide flippase family protein [Planctomycetota bacterium]